MATRSTISMVNPYDPTQVFSVYCHFDGYPEGVGFTLVNSFQTSSDVIALLSKGHIKILGETIEETVFLESNDFDPNEHSVFIRNGRLYGLDVQDYNYLFYDGSWYVMLSDNPSYFDLATGLRSIGHLKHPTDEVVTQSVIDPNEFGDLTVKHFEDSLENGEAITVIPSSNHHNLFIVVFQSIAHGVETQVIDRKLLSEMFGDIY